MRKQVKTSRAIALLAAMACTGTAPAAELVKFETVEFRVAQIQQRQAIERGETPITAPDTIEGYLSKPAGDGPFAAVVHLHGCGGLSRSTRNRVSELMTGWGYVSLVVDSYTTRGIKNSCDRLPTSRQGDALAALLYLSKLPFVDPERIAVVGSSQGGSVALRLASTKSVNLFAVPDELKFRAAVAYYPLCGTATRQLAIPTTILIGELDDWTPAKDCEDWMKLRDGKGPPVKLVVYPGAYHNFDNPTLAEGRRIFGHWLKYDAGAAQQSIQEMRDFLAAQLAN